VTKFVIIEVSQVPVAAADWVGPRPGNKANSAPIALALIVLSSKQLATLAAMARSTVPGEPPLAD